MKNKEEKNHEKTIHLYGREAVKDFFRDETKGGEEELNKRVDNLFKFPDGANVYLPYEMEIDGKKIIINRRVTNIVIHHNKDI